MDVVVEVEVLLEVELVVLVLVLVLVDVGARFTTHPARLWSPHSPLSRHCRVWIPAKPLGQAIGLLICPAFVCPKEPSIAGQWALLGTVGG